jgi:hypothetical protein
MFEFDRLVQALKGKDAESAYISRLKHYKKSKKKYSNHYRKIILEN